VVFIVISKEFGHGRLILSPTGSLDREIDDVRRYGDAARVGIERYNKTNKRMKVNLILRATAAGSVRPLLIVIEGVSKTTLQSNRIFEVSLLSVLAGLYQVSLPLFLKLIISATPSKREIR
jgi:hypothetical protein